MPAGTNSSWSFGSISKLHRERSKIDRNADVQALISFENDASFEGLSFEVRYQDVQVTIGMTGPKSLLGKNLTFILSKN